MSWKNTLEFGSTDVVDNVDVVVVVVIVVDVIDNDIIILIGSTK